MTPTGEKGLVITSILVFDISITVRAAKSWKTSLALAQMLDVVKGAYEIIIIPTRRPAISLKDSSHWFPVKRTKNGK